MNDKERRYPGGRPQRAMLRELNEAQLSMLKALEAYGWELKFIRRPMFAKGVPVVFDGERKKFAVLEADGSLNENPGFDIRH
jgi:hypothetical protein